MKRGLYRTLSPVQCQLCKIHPCLEKETWNVNSGCCGSWVHGRVYTCIFLIFWDVRFWMSEYSYFCECVVVGGGAWNTLKSDLQWRKRKVMTCCQWAPVEETVQGVSRDLGCLVVAEPGRYGCVPILKVRKWGSCRMGNLPWIPQQVRVFGTPGNGYPGHIEVQIFPRGLYPPV